MKDFHNLFIYFIFLGLTSQFNLIYIAQNHYAKPQRQGKLELCCSLCAAVQLFRFKFLFLSDCAYALVRYRHYKHLIRVRHTYRFCQQNNAADGPTSHPKYRVFGRLRRSWKLCWLHLKNIQWCHAYKCCKAMAPHQKYPVASQKETWNCGRRVWQACCLKWRANSVWKPAPTFAQPSTTTSMTLCNPKSVQ